jgi:hypothetical protein
MTLLSRTIFYTTGSFWFGMNMLQTSWQNKILYSMLEEKKIMNKLYMKNHNIYILDMSEKNKELK